MDEGHHPNSLTQPELALLAQNLVGLLYHLRDFLSSALALDGEEREQAFSQARQHAYDLVYIEFVPEDALAIRGAEGYQLPDFSERSAEDLRELVWAISGLALDLAQHLDFSTRYLKEEFKPAAYARAQLMATELADFPTADVRQLPVIPNIAVFGADGLEGWTR
jgi:hypothetical protein